MDILEFEDKSKKEFLFSFILNNICLSPIDRNKMVFENYKSVSLNEISNMLSKYWDTLSRKKQLIVLDYLKEIGGKDDN